MSGDDRSELSGLARSIDALFTNAPTPVRGPEPPPLPAEDAVEVPLPDASTDPALADLAVTPHVQESPAAFPHEADPAQPTDVVADRVGDVIRETDPDDPGPPLLEVDAAEELFVPLPVEDAATGVEPAVDVDAPSVDAVQEAELEEALGAYLAGEPGSGGRLEEAAAALRDRLALDPVADAVERLVSRAGDPPDPTIVDMASTIINPAVASRIVQRIGQVRDDAKKAEYTTLCHLLGEIMAKAFRGALTDATDRHARRAYYDMLIAMGDASRPIVEAMVDDDNRFLVRNAVAILGETGGGRAVELVTSALAHPDAKVRKEALLSLARLEASESASLVVGFIEDPDPDVRVAAATAAGELKVERALRPLLGLLDAEKDPDVLVPVIRALGQLGDPGAVPTLEKHAVRSLFSKPATEVRVASYRALHRIGSPHAKELVRAALEDKDGAVQAAARELARAERAK